MNYDREKRGRVKKSCPSLGHQWVFSKWTRQGPASPPRPPPSRVLGLPKHNLPDHENTEPNTGLPFSPAWIVSRPDMARPGQADRKTGPGPSAHLSLPLAPIRRSSGRPAITASSYKFSQILDPVQPRQSPQPPQQTFAVTFRLAQSGRSDKPFLRREADEATQSILKVLRCRT
jgi:hypothetical protein